MPTDYQFDALELCSDSLTNTLKNGIGTEFALPVMTTQEAIAATLLNWK
jgi:hypothetical protein